MYFTYNLNNLHKDCFTLLRYNYGPVYIGTKKLLIRRDKIIPFSNNEYIIHVKNLIGEHVFKSNVTGNVIKFNPETLQAFILYSDNIYFRMSNCTTIILADNGGIVLYNGFFM